MADSNQRVDQSATRPTPDKLSLRLQGGPSVSSDGERLSHALPRAQGIDDPVGFFRRPVFQVLDQ